jgi:hypothetical protein
MPPGLKEYVQIKMYVGFNFTTRKTGIFSLVMAYRAIAKSLIYHERSITLLPIYSCTFPSDLCSMKLS